MSQRTSVLFHLLKSPAQILALMLAVIFVIEALLMLLIPSLLPIEFGHTGRALVDAGLLTLVCAPVLWWLIVGPLRNIAVREHSRYETIVANAQEGIITLDADRRIMSANQAACELFGCDTEKLLFSAIDDFVKLERHPSELSAIIEAEGNRMDGPPFPVRISVSRFPSSSESAWIVILQDLTEAKRNEEQKVQQAREREVLRTQQMATLAELATGVAHEIRNPLTSVKMLIQVNRDKFAEHGLPTDDLELVVREIRRMEKLVTGLLDYARPDRAEAAPFGINPLIENIRRLLLTRCQSQNVQFRVQLEESDIRVQGDAAQIQQLLLNLAINALDAMPTGGTLTCHAWQNGASLEINVTDTGPGIDKQIASRLFSPFNTTKPTGVGLGLGISRRIAEAHGGTLEGANREEGGACFHLSLPLTGPETCQTTATP